MSEKTILDEIVESIKESDIDKQLKQLCDKIQEEEDEKKGITKGLEKYRPDYQNIFLVFEIKPISNNQYNFLTLEREMPEKYIIGLWSKNKYNDKPTKRINTWEINEVKPKKVIKEFAKTLKIYK